MSKKITVKTSSGNKYYKISEISGSYKCSINNGEVLFETWTEIGKAKHFEDALLLVKSHATKYGSVLKTDIN